MRRGIRVMRLGILGRLRGIRVMRLGILGRLRGIRVMRRGILGRLRGIRVMRLGILGRLRGIRVMRLGILVMRRAIRVMRRGILVRRLGIRVMRRGTLATATAEVNGALAMAGFVVCTGRSRCVYRNRFFAAAQHLIRGQNQQIPRRSEGPVQRARRDSNSRPSDP